MLVNLADMKAYLKVTGNDDDNFLTTQIQIVSEAIEAYCRRKFEKRTYTQTFYAEDYPRSTQIYLSVYPVSQIISYAPLLDVSQLRLQKLAGVLTRGEGFFYAPVTVIKYVAGYEYADIPKLIQSVVYGVVEERFNKKAAGVGLNFGSDVQRVSIPGTISIDFDYTLTNNDRTTAFGGIIGNYLNILDSFRSDRAILGAGTLTYVEEEA
jgi:hypothetical protein